MSYISEKIAYLDGLADGQEIGEEKYGKVIRGIIDVLGAMAEELEEQNETIDDLSDCIDEIYDELDDLEDACDDAFDEDEFVEIDCPKCGETIYFDMDMLDSENGLLCPNCNTAIELEISECGCGCCCQDDDDDDEDEEDEDDDD